MTGDELGLKLRGARERLCVAQVEITPFDYQPGGPLRHRLQDAINIIDRVGVMVDPHWSVHAEPTIEEP